jgi:uncharacterized protein (TIRG00374 family)
MQRRTIATIILTAAGLLVVVEVVLMHDQLAAALRVLTGAHPVWVLIAVAATAVSMQSFARTQRRMLNAADPGSRGEVTVVRMVALTYTANALNMTLPAGSAVSVAYVVNRLRGWGSTSATAIFTVVASGVLSSGTFFALAAGCALAAGASGTTGVVRELAVAAAVTLVAVIVWHHRRTHDGTPRDALRTVLAYLERQLRRISVRKADALHDATEGLAGIRPRRQDWIAGTALAALNWLADFACLVASCHAVDIAVTAPVVLLTAYLAGMSASSIAFLPGGFGVIEVAMIAALHTGGVPVAPATAAVLLYRVISCVCVVAAGWAIWSGRALAHLQHRPNGVRSVPPRTSVTMLGE